MVNTPAALLHQLRSGDVVLDAALLLLVTAGLTRSAGALGRPSLWWTARYWRFAWQIGTILGLEQAYEFTRARIPQNSDVALVNAYRLLDLEWQHGFFVEERVQRFFLHYHGVMNAVDLFYVLPHVGVTVGAVSWIYLKRRQHYPFIRNLLIVTTAIALIAFYVYPTAPPRMLPNYGFVDPLILHHIVPYGGDQPDSYTYNPYAAMPSLHVGYALVVGWTLLAAERRLWIRLLAVLYPVMMAAVVIITGNHWLLDVAGAIVTVALAGIIVRALSAGLPAAGRFAMERVRRAMGAGAEVPA